MPGGYGMPGPDPAVEAIRKKATNSLIISIVSLLCCAPLAILSLIWSSQALDSYRSMPGAPGETNAKAARIISIIALAIWAVLLFANLVGGGFNF
jgi:hypothetical protein